MFVENLNVKKNAFGECRARDKFRRVFGKGGNSSVVIKFVRLPFVKDNYKVIARRIFPIRCGTSVPKIPIC